MTPDLRSLRFVLPALLLGFCLAVLPGCDPETPESPDATGSETQGGGSTGGAERAPGPVGPRAQQRNVLDALAAAGEFNEFVRWIRRLDIEISFRAADGITVFAPTDEAFAALPADAFEGFEDDPAIASAPMLFHVMRNGARSTEQLKQIRPNTLQSVIGPAPEVRSEAGTLTVGGASIVRPDIECTNGVIHGIDRFLMPPR